MSEIEENKDVHTEHCCIRHGCKYGHKDCTVATGEKEQSYECEDCGYEEVGFSQWRDNQKKIDGYDKLKEENEKLRAFVEEVRDSPLYSVTTATGRYGGDETTEYCDGYFKEEAKDLLEEI